MVMMLDMPNTIETPVWHAISISLKQKEKVNITQAKKKKIKE
jgi:hypothetical protein